jgi:hypothetical protein
MYFCEYRIIQLIISLYSINQLAFLMEEMLCSLWGRKWNLYMYYLDERKRHTIRMCVWEMAMAVNIKIINIWRDAA